MDKLNRDELYLICKKLDTKSILNLSIVNKNLRQKIIFHESILNQQNPLLQAIRISLQGVLKYGSSFAIPFPSKIDFYIPKIKLSK
jgi:hypothetical protein